MSITIPTWDIGVDVKQFKQERLRQMIHFLRDIDAGAITKLYRLCPAPFADSQVDNAIDLLERHYRKLRRTALTTASPPEPTPPGEGEGGGRASL